MGTPQHDPDEIWVDLDAGPVVRPYAMTGGRTQASGRFDLVSMIMTSRSVSGADVLDLGPEHEAILRRCRQPTSVAELSAHLNLPVGTIRVLLGDLLSRMLIMANNPDPIPALPEDDIFEEVLNGIRNL
jgi:hypothetical protein